MKGGLHELALFSGAGGGILGGKLIGWRTVCAVELDTYARDVLVARQDDGSLSPFPIWDDITTFDGRPWRGCVDVVSGGFPCQDISVAGKGAGITGERSGLWKHMARVVDEVRPRFVFVENSPMLVKRGLAVVLGDLAALGYDARWCVLGAHNVGAPHKRDRVWIVANANCERESQPGRCECEERGWTGHSGEQLADSDGQRGLRRQTECSEHPVDVDARGEIGMQDTKGIHQAELAWWSRDPADEAGAFERGMGRVVDGMAHRLDRLRCLGNGQVPAVARLAWEILS